MKTPAELPAIKISLSVTRKHDKPYLELRRGIADRELMMAIIQAAFNGQHLIFLPQFNDLPQATHYLIQNGIIEYNPYLRQYFFLESEKKEEK